MLIAIVAAISLRRSRAFHENERFHEDAAATGVGDDRYFTLPVSSRPVYRVCQYGTGTIVAAASLPLVSPDSEMKRVGACTSPQQLNLYVREHDPSHLFVKTDIYRYLEVRLQ